MSESDPVFREAQLALQDPRCQPGAYISRATSDFARLAEVVDQDGMDVIYVDAKTETRWRAPAHRVLEEWMLVREAPHAPDVLEAA